MVIPTALRNSASHVAIVLLLLFLGLLAYGISWEGVKLGYGATTLFAASASQSRDSSGHSALERGNRRLAFNMIGFPLHVEQSFADKNLPYTAEGLADYYGPAVKSVMQWNSSAQLLDIWDPSSRTGVIGGVVTRTAFPLTTGGVYWILVDSTATSPFALSGKVPEAGSLQYRWAGNSPTCRFNTFVLPLHRSDITNAQEFAGEIGVDRVASVMTWNASLQDVDTWDVASETGVVNGTPTNNPADFPLRIGFPYITCMLEAADGVIWPE